MLDPSVEILGVYKPTIPPDIYEWGIEEKGPDYWETLVLIEALARNAGGLLEMGQVRPATFMGSRSKLFSLCLR